MRMTAFISVVVLGVFAGASASVFHGMWRIEGNDRLIMNETEGVAPGEVVLTVGTSARVESGQITFPNGVERQATPGEMRYYWISRGGVHAWWKHLHATNRLKTMTVGPDTVLPTDWTGRTIACLTTSGKQYVGRMVALPSGDNRWFSLDIEGALGPVPFHLSALHEIRTLK